MSSHVTAVPAAAAHVGVIELHRPPNNFLDVSVLDGILDGITTLVADGCRAVVLRAEGKHFCAGRDFSAPRQPGDSPEDMYERAARLYDSPVPLVAEIQGAAVGAGLGLAAVADFRVVGPRAYFWANFVRLESHPGFGLTARLPALVGEQRARWMFTACERVGAETAVGWGLADELVPDDRLGARTLEIAAQIASSSPEAVAALRRTLRPESALESFRQATRHEAAEQARLRSRNRQEEHA